MPTDKALKRDALLSNPWWRTLAKWRNLTRRTSSDQELTSNGWTNLSRCVGLERRRENLMARAARPKRNGCPPFLGGLALQSILSGAFSANDEDSTNCLNRRTWDRLLMPACGRNARRPGNFREGERQHIVRGKRAQV